ncbi:hypothetical protein [Jatrophihabitans lederbergiae]|uniref:Two-component sensor histidine kinase n=1 Tax=Jatrophihabitans lederbergiae TaxID=3075547 RepID=A0ABU2JIX7_9ACTN|nr:hypothetical protein [Jatrophihabitans sp. DSM 44399]MDT0264439.1 hypothetical protein [Jatrophihabitans sp. DSM 44399]
MSRNRFGQRLGRLRARSATLRARVTVVASLAITAAVVLGVLFMYVLQMQSVRRTIDGQLRTYATQIAQSAPTGAWQQPLAGSSLDANAEAQVLAPDGGGAGRDPLVSGSPRGLHPARRRERPGTAESSRRGDPD